MRFKLSVGLSLILAHFGLHSISLWRFALSSPGIDLFCFWAIGAAHDSVTYQLCSPYLAAARYTEVLSQLLQAEGPELLAVARAALPFDLTATRLLYYLHALAPFDYLQFLTVYRGMQLSCAWFALVLACWRLPWWERLLLATTICVACDALLLDVNVGNTNALQMLGLCCCMLLFERFGRLNALVLPDNCIATESRGER